MAAKPLILFTLLLLLSGAAPADVAPTAASGEPELSIGGGAAKRCRGVHVGVSTNLRAAVARHRRGTTFCIAAGVHRLRTFVVPKDGDTFTGEPGAVLSGAVALRSFERSGRFWVARQRVPANPVVAGRCRPGTGAACTLANDVYLDDRPLKRVLDRRDLRVGRFYVDERENRLQIGSNPTGHRVEAAVATRAFKGWETGADRVRIQGLVIEKFANEAGIGAVNGRPSWIIVDNVVRLNHGGGIQDAGVIRGNVVSRNGQIGVLGSYGTGQVVADNEIGFNNYAGYDPQWEAGGAKWVRSTRLVVRSNRVHDNRGPGLWTDGGSEGVLYERNVVERNSGAGILHEISYAATLRDNVVRRNGFGSHGWLDGAGIVLSASSRVEVYGNTVVDNRNGIGIVQTNRGRSDPRLPPHEAADVYVHDNTIRMRVGHTGLVQNVGDTAYYTSKNNRFVSNRYVLGCNPTYFMWQDSTGAQAYRDLSVRQWVATGNDASGSFRKSCEP